jgi:hypothetical protein
MLERKILIYFTLSQIAILGITEIVRVLVCLKSQQKMSLNATVKYTDSCLML